MPPDLQLIYPRRKLEVIVTQMERPLNELLMKLFLVPENESAPQWKSAAEEYLGELEMFRLKPTGQPVEEIFYFQILYEEPYGQARQNVRTQIERLRSHHSLPMRDMTMEIHKKLEIFHRRLARSLSKGETGLSERLLP